MIDQLTRRYGTDGRGSDLTRKDRSPLDALNNSLL